MTSPGGSSGASRPVWKVLPGAEPFRFEGGPVGALLLHGFTGSPASMRPLGEFLAEHGVAVTGPRLPGHGSSWEELSTTSQKDWLAEADAGLEELRSRTGAVVCVGMSMGAALGVHLCARYAEVRGLVLINPYLRDPRLAGARVARLFTRSVGGVINDIKKPGQDEVGYERIPTRALPSLRAVLRSAEAELPTLTQPLLVFSSPEDHTVKPANSSLAMERAGSGDKELVRLPNSYHVATLDYDAEALFERTLAFIERVSTPAPPAPPGL
jgi:carboxylesterase